MRKLTLLLFLLTFTGSVMFASGPEGEELLRKAALAVEETSQQKYSGKEAERKTSIDTLLPKPDEKNVVITFTIDELNRIHVVDVQGGYAYINLYIKSSLEGKALKTESAIPGINYVMAIKLPASA